MTVRRYRVRCYACAVQCASQCPEAFTGCTRHNLAAYTCGRTHRPDRCRACGSRLIVVRRLALKVIS